MTEAGTGTDRRDLSPVWHQGAHLPLLLFRAVRFLTVEGVRQFMDIGTGLPTADNSHEVAQRFAPESRIVYVDNDPLVLQGIGKVLPIGGEPSSPATP